MLCVGVCGGDMHREAEVAELGNAGGSITAGCTLHAHATATSVPCLLQHA